VTNNPDTAADDASNNQAGGHEPLTTKEGWRRFVEDTPNPPELLDPAALSAAERETYDDARLAYHSRLAVVATPDVAQVTLTGRRLIVLNRHQLSARRGLIVTGAAGTGKTTAITQLGKAHELALRLRHPTGGPRLPVVYVTVPPAATPRMLAVEFARFLGLPLTTRSNITDVTDAVCAVLTDLGCDLVIIDELHNLNLATRTGAEVSDQLKYFSERLPATFVYAGIDVERVGLFTGTRGRQIASRFATIPTKPFGYATTTQRQQWQALVATLEQTLRLRRHPAHSLLGIAKHLHHRTGGMIGSLSHLIRGAAIDAIITGTEEITKANLDAVRLDHTAETHQATTHAKPTTKPTTGRARRQSSGVA
jgi:hypothetical protein